MKKMEARELKVKTIIAFAWLIFAGIIMISEYLIALHINYVYPNKWYIIPAMFRGMKMIDVYHYCFQQTWWQIALAIVLALGLILIPNAAYPLFCDTKDKK